MLLFWKIRYLDRADRQFKDRCIYLDTRTLDPITRAAVELVVEAKSSMTEREILKYRNLFNEKAQDGALWDKCIVLVDYFEDENGTEITLQELGPILTGNPTARLMPRGAKQHDIEFMLAAPKPVPFGEVALTAESLRVLGYFVRDLNEMIDSAFMKDGPGTLSYGGHNPSLKTAVSDEEIRSFVTIFRRLYMDNEPANLKNAVEVFVRALGDHPRAKWVAGVAKEYQNHLNATPDFRPFMGKGAFTHTVKRLIDVFLYTQYAHQPDERRQRQFGECLSAVNGNRVFLFWMFLTEIWKCSLEIGNAGRIISWWFKQYCDHHGVSPDVLDSIRHDHSGLGAAEKEEDRLARLFREKTEQLAMDLWKENGHSDGGPSQFLAIAREQLTQERGR